jgi:hypothetical protein
MSKTDVRSVDVKVLGLSRSDRTVKFSLNDDKQLIAIAHLSVKHPSAIGGLNLSVNYLRVGCLKYADAVYRLGELRHRVEHLPALSVKAPWARDVLVWFQKV